MDTTRAETSGGRTIGELGEFGLIARVVREPLSSRVIVGPGDDCASVRVGAGSVLVSTDMLVEGRHFRRDWAEPYDVGRRAAAANLADVMAMGGVATALTVGFAAPGDLETVWAEDLTRGIVEEAALVGAEVVGGDVTAADAVTLAITVLGESAQAPVLRSGARPGDLVAITGRLGWAGAGLHVLARGFRSPRVLVEAYRRPEPPYDEGPRAAAHGATAMIDVSDGLLADLGHVATSSGVGIALVGSAFDVPDPIADVAAATNADPLGFLLTGGDDHTLAATFPADRGAPEGWTIVGRVVDGEGDVTVDGAAWDGPEGHEHYR
ncbi:thiamine-phosphate kinase [Mumia sp. zg.B17]|uniref:thiamine-phosphate kinase n=1 Tax=Mumia sp. zg.B17 TaxID=2855446 RepID=UPI001C6EBDA7|nr:thiamine-phosphate kinase [Mumia sp. zg.B17]MBW9206402.1 thiamine-phosphate kinase [Mumia sp. zg.B17]